MTVTTHVEQGFPPAVNLEMNVKHPEATEITFGGSPQGAADQHYRVAGDAVITVDDWFRKKLVLAFGGKNEVRYEFDQNTGLWSKPGERAGFAWVRVSAAAKEE